MKYIDMHCDTILGWLEQEEGREEVDFAQSDLSVDLDKLKRGGCLVQNFALFTDRKKYAVPEKQTMKLYDLYCRMIEQNEDRIAPVLRFSDIEKNEKEGKLSALLTLEEGDVVFNDLAMLRKGGVMGLNFCADFLNERGDERSTIEDMIAHIDHIRDIAGIDVIGIGTDFDGILSDVEVRDASMMPALARALQEHGYTEEEIDSIMYKNVLRVYKKGLK